MTKLLVAFAFLALNVYTDHYLGRRGTVPERASFAGFPQELEDWHCPSKGTIDDETLKNLGATDYLICDYFRPDYEPVGVYIGYHASQVYEDGTGYGGENSIHPPSHCLPGSGWDIIDSRNVVLDIPGLPQPGARVKRLIIARGEARQLVYYWYQTQGRVLADDWQKILFVGYDRATRGRTDGALVRFTVPLRRGVDEARAERSFEGVARLVLPRLGAYIPE